MSEHEVKPHSVPVKGMSVYIFLCNEDVQRLHIPMWSHALDDLFRLRNCKNYSGAPKFEKVIATLLQEGELDHVRVQYAPDYIKLWTK